MNYLYREVLFLCLYCILTKTTENDFYNIHFKALEKFLSAIIDCVCAFWN